MPDKKARAKQKKSPATGDAVPVARASAKAQTSRKGAKTQSKRSGLSKASHKFSPTLGELDLHLFGEGKHERIYEKLGTARTIRCDGWAIVACGSFSFPVCRKVNCTSTRSRLAGTSFSKPIPTPL